MPTGAVIGVLVLGAIAVALVILALDVRAGPGDLGSGKKRKQMQPGIGGP